MSGYSQALIATYETRVPRYTSYPTAPYFLVAGHDGTYREWLGQLDPLVPLSLYLHVPFCAAMCWYCGCNTQVAKSRQPVADYVALIEREMTLVADSLPARMRVSHIHWGGGTPNSLAPADFTRLMTGLRRRFDILEGAEIAVEIDPRHLTTEQVEAYAEAGVTRASLGVQTLDDRIQRAINRIQPFDCVAAAARQLRAAGIQRLNFDLIYGLPGQTTADVVATVAESLLLNPDRIALFGYAHVPWVKPHQRRIDEAALPPGPERLEQFLAAARHLAQAGYAQIGLDHFARADDPLAAAAAAGQLHRNFQGYTTDAAETLIGLGPSAIGALPQGYVQNDPGFRAWSDHVAAGRLPIARWRGLIEDDRRRRAVIERLMCDGRVDLDRFGGWSGFPEARDRLDRMVEAGLVEIDASGVTVTDFGRPFLRAAASAFDRYLGLGTAQHSSGV